MATWWDWVVPLPRNFGTYRFLCKSWENTSSLIIENVSYVLYKALEQQTFTCRRDWQKMKKLWQNCDTPIKKWIIK